MAATVIEAQSPSTPNATSFVRTYYSVLGLSEVNKVDGVEQSFYIDGQFVTYYQEPLIPTASLPPPFVVIELPAAARSALSTALFEPQFENRRDLKQEETKYFLMSQRPPALERVTVPNELPGVGWIAYSTRISGLFKASLALANFPFDEQTLWVNVTATSPMFIGRYAGDWLPTLDPVAGVDEVIGWDILGSRTRNSSTYYPEYGLDFPRKSWAITMKRKPAYYLNKIVFGIVIITFMSIFSFLIDPRDTNRPMAAMTSFMGIVTYLFVISTDVPKVAYLTKLDMFVNASFAVVAVNFFIHIFLYVVATAADRALDDAKKQAERAAKKYDAAPPMPRLPTKAAYEDGTPDAPADDSTAPDADEDPTGWWTVAHRLARPIDALLLVLHTVAYTIVTVLLNR